MKTKVILIQPITPTLRKTYFFPLACLALAAVLKKENFDPVLVDLNIHDDYRERIKEHLDNALFAGISVMTDKWQIKNALEISGYVRSLNNKIPVVWGGWYPTCSTEDVLKDERVDIVVRGEGEITVPKLTKALRDNKPLSDIEGIAYRKKGEVVYVPSADLVSDLDSLPYLPWELVGLSGNKKISIHTLQVQTGRGCEMECAFCAHKVLYPGKNHRIFSASYILDNVERAFRSFNINYITFYEGTCLNSAKRVEELCGEISRRGMNIPWEASSRANIFPYFGGETHELLKQNKCDKIPFGFESGSQVILDRLAKRERIEDIYNTVKICRRRRFKIEGYFMFDLPFEKVTDLLKTLMMMWYIKMMLPSSRLFLIRYSPCPGTILYEEYKNRPYETGVLLRFMYTIYDTLRLLRLRFRSRLLRRRTFG